MRRDRKSTRLNSSHVEISYAVFCLKKKNSTPTRSRSRTGMANPSLNRYGESKERRPAWTLISDPTEPMSVCCSSFFFFNDTATTEIYTLSLHDALPISSRGGRTSSSPAPTILDSRPRTRSEEHTSELQSRRELVCRLLLEKKKTIV